MSKRKCHNQTESFTSLKESIIIKQEVFFLLTEIITIK